MLVRVTNPTNMQPPEESFPSGLTYPRFKSVYAQHRRGAKPQEVSLAWERYKNLSSMGIQQTSPLCSMPHELLRILPKYHRSVLGLLKRTCRRLNYLLKSGTEYLYNSGVSKTEFIEYLKARLEEHFTENTKCLILVRFTILHDDMASYHRWTIVNPLGSRPHGTIEVGHSYHSTCLFLDGTKARTSADLAVNDIREPKAIITRIMTVLSKYYIKDGMLSSNVIISEQDLTRIIARRNHPNKDFASQYVRKVGFSLFLDACSIDSIIDTTNRQELQTRLDSVLRSSLSKFLRLAMLVTWTAMFSSGIPLVPGQHNHDDEHTIWSLGDQNTVLTQEGESYRDVVRTMLLDWLFYTTRAYRGEIEKQIITAEDRRMQSQAAQMMRLLNLTI